MRHDFFQLWVYLSTSPLSGLTFTLVAYCAGLFVARSLRLHPLANPVAIAVAVLVALLTLTDIHVPQIL